MRAEALQLFRKLFLNKYARVINYFGLLCHTAKREIANLAPANLLLKVLYGTSVHVYLRTAVHVRVLLRVRRGKISCWETRRFSSPNPTFEGAPDVQPTCRQGEK